MSTFILDLAQALNHAPGTELSVGSAAGPPPIYIHWTTDIEQVRAERQADNGYFRPVIDLSGRHPVDADLSFALGERFDLDRVGAVSAAFVRRKMELGSWTEYAIDPEYRLLVYLWVANRTLQARYDPQHKCGYTHGQLLPVGNALTYAERLASAGLLTRVHFERQHVCPQCDGARLNIREECASCRSSNLHDAGILHHYRCAYLGPERDFVAHDDRLICPKCTRELRHYGTDHERAGEAVECLACGHFASTPDIGFVCMDCGKHTATETIMTRDIHHYALSPAGLDLIRSSSSPTSLRTTIVHHSLPLELIAALARLRRSTKQEVVVYELGYPAMADGARNGRQFDRWRNHFTTMLRSALGSNAQLIVGAAFDYVVPYDGPSLTSREVSEGVKLVGSRMKGQLPVEIRAIDAAQIGL
jgi:hypothetical protein